MEVLGKFGINPILLAAQIVNFLIILYIIKRFALKPIMKILKNREETIAKGLKEAEEARELLERSVEKEKAVLQKAQIEARKLLDEAKEHRESVIREAQESAKSQTESMLKEAKEQIARDTIDVEKRLVAHVTDLAIAIVQKSSSELFPQKDQSAIVEKALKNLKKKAD
ncbi:MAG: F0F1 ATP synthase subunit B [Candidatus Levybacteria bacterium]|nr:F0F1 ATP synthase subunit B [Candidatus Levybacteria bacterium]